MSKTLKILLTPFMVVLSLIVLTIGFIWFKILIPLYKFAWEGWS